jgi:hypothetical protein
MLPLMLIILGPNFEYLQNGTYVSTARRVTQIFIAYAVIYRSAMIAFTKLNSSYWEYGEKDYAFGA